MRRICLATARVALLAAIGIASGPLFGQEEPALIPPEAAPAPETPAQDTTPPATATGPLRPALDFQRWREMTARERQTFVEGAILSLTAMAQHLKANLEVDGRIPPENLAAIVRVVYDTYPKFPSSAYLREMEHIYMRADGQTLTMAECFQQAYRRINAL